MKEATIGSSSSFTEAQSLVINIRWYDDVFETCRFEQKEEAIIRSG